jgi:hypothetical protein
MQTINEARPAWKLLLRRFVAALLSALAAPAF